MMDDTTNPYGDFSAIPDDVLAELLGMGTLDERGDLLAQQMQQAQALRQGGGGQHSTGIGAVLGGLSDSLRYVQGTEKMDSLRAQQEALLDKKDAGRGRYVNALRRQGRPMPEDASGVPPSVPFGL
jgi:hypothetical protein